MKYGVWNQMKIWSSHLLDNRPFAWWRHFTTKTRIPLVASIARLIFPIVSLYPREKMNLNKKAFWQSIVVLVVKWRHHANGLFKQLSHEPEKFRWLNGIRTHDLCEPVQCSNQLSYEVTQLRAGQFVGLMFSRERNVVWKGKTGKHEPNKLTCSQLCDFVAQLVRALHRYRRGHGFESRWVTWIFQVYETIA